MLIFGIGMAKRMYLKSPDTMERTMYLYDPVKWFIGLVNRYVVQHLYYAGGIYTAYSFRRYCLVCPLARYEDHFLSEMVETEQVGGYDEVRVWTS